MRPTILATPQQNGERILANQAATRNDLGYVPHTETPCPHCKHNTQSGVHGGCYDCGKVKTTKDGRLPPQWDE